MGSYGNAANRQSSSDHASEFSTPAAPADNGYGGYGVEEAIANARKLPGIIAEDAKGQGYGDGSAGTATNVDSDTFPTGHAPHAS